MQIGKNFDPATKSTSEKTPLQVSKKNYLKSRQSSRSKKRVLESFTQTSVLKNLKEILAKKTV